LQTKVGMLKYRFIAIDDAGKERKGMVEALSRNAASRQIRSYGLTPARVTVVKAEEVGAARSAAGPRSAFAARRPMYFGPAIDKKRLAEFTRKLATLLRAGLTLLRSLEVLKSQERSSVFKWILGNIVERIESGSNFSDALAAFPKEFDYLFVNMTRAGEASGMMELSLDRLATYMEKNQRMKSRLSSAMAYPAVVTALSVLIVIGLLLFVVPRFEGIFLEEIGQEKMPELTGYVLMASEVAMTNWMWLIGGLFAVLLLLKLLGKTSPGRALFDWFQLRLPGLGDLVTKIQVIRFSRTLGTLIESSVPILEALRITKDTCGNVHVVSAVDKLLSKVKDGEGIAATLSETKIFPLMLVSMVEVGEETGDLPSMLSQVADVYDEEVDAAISGLVSVLQPLMIVALAVVVILIVLALFLPFVSIMESYGAG